VLAVGILHQIFDASNNSGGMTNYILDGAGSTQIDGVAEERVHLLLGDDRADAGATER
jgi:hypothetical protein